MTFAAASRMIEFGLCDAAVVGGVDSLCLTTLYGFHALQLTAEGPCRPFDAARDGISIGEAGGFALLQRDRGNGGVSLLGFGESSDAHHMSSPHPEGLGARLAMEKALATAGLGPSDIDYINLHGTATKVGDAAEDKAVAGLFGRSTPCSSTKGLTGHTLGASGIVEAIISVLGILHGFIPASPTTRTVDPKLESRYLCEGAEQPLRRVDEQFLRVRRQQLQPDLRAGVMELYLDGIGLCAGGLPNWAEGRGVLAGTKPYSVAEIILTASTLLPPAERRRTTDTVKLAMTVGSEAIAHAGLRAEDTASVFTSSGGDGKTITAILEVLASPLREVSPTRFHNSVHNAPAGYWSIATQCREASTSICAYDYSFAAGLLEAATRALAEQSPVLLVAYERALSAWPRSPPARNIAAPFGDSAGGRAGDRTRPHAGRASRSRCAGTPESETVLDDPALEALQGRRSGGAGACPLLCRRWRARRRAGGYPFACCQ